MKLTVGISEFAVSKNRDDEITTHALGSCVGIVLYDKVTKVGAMLHYMLPTNNQNNHNNHSPLMYADTGIPLLLDQYIKAGGSMKNLEIKAAGGASINDHNDIFEIGKKNVLMLKKILWEKNLVLSKGDFGGTDYRTMTLYLSDGRVTLKNHKTGLREL